MKKKTRIKTTVEMHEVWVITEPQEAPTELCQICANQEATMLAPEVAAAVAGISLRSLFRLVEAGEVHYLERADGTLLVCLNSLPADPQAVAPRGLLPSA